MKRNDLTKLHHEPVDKLESKLSSLRSELVITRLKINSNQEKNTSKAKNIRKDIARVLTILTSKKSHQTQNPSSKTKAVKESKVLSPSGLSLKGEDQSKGKAPDSPKAKALSLSKESKPKPEKLSSKKSS